MSSMLTVCSISSRDLVHGSEREKVSSGHRREVVHGFLGHCIFVMRLYEGLESQAGG